MTPQIKCRQQVTLPMTPLIKNAANAILRLLCMPLRLLYRRRNGIAEEIVRKELPNNILLGAVRDAIREGHSATIIVKGRSMRPFLEHLRDKVVLDSPLGASIYDAVLAELHPGHYVLHRIIDISHDTLDEQEDLITLMGDGNIRGTEQCQRKDLCGKVTLYIRPGRTIPADDPKLMQQIRWWRRLLPMRRLLLAVYKALI